MSEIRSQRLNGIKVSRLPVDFESRQGSNLGYRVQKHKEIHLSRVEAKVEQEALIDFKCNNSAFHTATVARKIPVQLLKHGATA